MSSVQRIVRWQCGQLRNSCSVIAVIGPSLGNAPPIIQIVPNLLGSQDAIDPIAGAATFKSAADVRSHLAGTYLGRSQSSSTCTTDRLSAKVTLARAVDLFASTPEDQDFDDRLTVWA